MKKNSSKLLSLLLSVLLIMAAAVTTGCTDGKNEETSDTSSDVTETITEAENLTYLGEGATQFKFTVVDADGDSVIFEIHTDCKTVGEALVSLGLISGDYEAYGLYVKTVNGQTYDYATDGKYWAFYIGNTLATTGVDNTNIVDGESYSFKAE